MRVLAFSDLHRDHAKAENILVLCRDADVVVGAGDFATRGIGLPDTLDILRRITVPLVLVPGNHESFDALKTACHGWQAAHVLHGTAATVFSVTFFGLGYEISTLSKGAWNNQMTEEQASISLAGCPDGAILITHVPPYGVADRQADGSHGGSPAIRAAIEAKTPRLNLCGHIHDAWGQSGVIGACRVHNLGPAAQWFDM